MSEAAKTDQVGLRGVRGRNAAAGRHNDIVRGVAVPAGESSV